MAQMQKEEIIQAVLVADNFNENLSPLTLETSAALVPLVNVPLIDYALEALNRSGVEEVFVFCSTFMDQVKKHIQNGVAKKHSWSIRMTVQVVGSEGCRCLGDALRDLDAKGLIRGHFILMGCDTITSAQLGTLLDQHKRHCRLDKGTAMTIALKQTSPGQRTGNEVVVAVDSDSQRLLFHQRQTVQTKERTFEFPLEIFLVNGIVELRHDMLDAQIAVCAPSALPLFTDNFDFATRDDFIRGLLINEEILASTMYVYELPAQQYAARCSDWQSYQLVSHDIINRWTYPLVPDMGVCANRQMYMFLRNNVYRSADVQLARGSQLREDVVVRSGSAIGDGTVVGRSVLGAACRVGKNCVLENAYLMDGCVVGDGCELRHCVLGRGVRLGDGARVVDGAALGDGVEIEAGVAVAKHFVQATRPAAAFGGDDDDDDDVQQLGDKAFVIPDDEDAGDQDSDDDDDVVRMGIVRMSAVKHNYASSAYSSSSDDTDSRPASPMQEDSNIFLSEVIDSLNRGYSEKSNPDFLILEINSSRYAYNMSLTEVNFYVVKAVLALEPIANAATEAAILTAFKQVLNHLAPMFRNYIRGADAQRDCLMAIAESCGQADRMRGIVARIVHYLYDQDVLSEEAILKWHAELVEGGEESTKWVREALGKLVAWLEESSDEDEDDSDDDE